MDAATAATLSRVELEPVLVRDVLIGDEVSAEVIRQELASRVWQGTNPYATETPVPEPPVSPPAPTPPVPPVPDA